MIVFRKLIILILIQAFILSNSLYAGQIYISADDKTDKSTLSPQIAIDLNLFQQSYDIYLQKIPLTDDIVLPAGLGLINPVDILEHGTVINGKTTNFKIGKDSFRIPPYLSGRVARLHITAINQNGFAFQKMGIGVGRRKKTIAVVLVDLNNFDNQLIVFVQDNKALIKALDKASVKEVTMLGDNQQFSAMARQDSFLERSKPGVDFLNRVLGINELGNAKPLQVVDGLNSIALNNPKLKKNIPINLAFFSKDYMLSFSENLVKHAHVAVLRDREQRGRYIAIIDKLNSDNRVVFERRGDQVYVLGVNERALIPKLEKHASAQVTYFSDLQEGAEFCRNITRNLLQLNFSAKTSSISMNKKVQLNVGAYNNDASILKVGQVTKATVTGYQIKQKQPEFLDQEATAYPVCILRNDFNDDISVTDTDIDYESDEYIFFNPAQTGKWPKYLSYCSADNSVYYQQINGIYTHEQQDYIAYKAIGKDDILTYLSFNNDNSFTIKGINWKDEKPVVFRNIKNIALSNIVTQLKSSEFIKIDPVLDEYFNVTGLETGINPMRSTYIYINGVFEQGNNENMGREVDFTEIQKNEDRKIKRYQKKNKLHISKAALIFSVLSMVFNATNLFAAGMGETAFDIASKYYFFESLFAGSILVVGMILYRLVAWAKKKFAPMGRISFDSTRRDFIRTGSIRALIGFLILQTGVLAFMQIFSQLKDIRMQGKLRPAMVESLTKLAIVYEQMPSSFYAQNKRLSFPMSAQYWQVFLNLSQEEAEKAASIYKENAEAVLVMYAQPNMQIQNMNAAQLLRIIASRIQGTDISIKRGKAIPQKKQDKTLQVNASDEDSTVNGMATGVAVAIISPWVPDTSNRLLETIIGKPSIVPVEPVEGVEKVKREKQRNPYSGQEERKYNDISKSGRLLSQNLDLIEDIKKSVNAKGQTYFSLKQRGSDKDDNFVIRPIETEEEIEAFERSAAGKLNFKWKKHFNMINGLKANSKEKNRFCIYGVFILDEYGHEQDIVAAANYLIRDIDNQTVLNPLRIEVLPNMQKAYSGIGRALCTKVFSDALTKDNLPLTQGRIFFGAENKGKGKDPVGFYKEAFGLEPNMKKVADGSLNETIYFDLSLEDTLELMKKEFDNIGFSPKLSIRRTVDILTEIDLNQKAEQLVGQSI